jgi:hypothetical protein
LAFGRRQRVRRFDGDDARGEIDEENPGVPRLVAGAGEKHCKRFAIIDWFDETG